MATVSDFNRNYIDEVVPQDETSCGVWSLYLMEDGRLVAADGDGLMEGVKRFLGNIDLDPEDDPFET